MFDAERAWYVRAVNNSERGDKVKSVRRYQTCDGRLNVDAMRDAAAALTGTHDFSSFRANGCQASSPVRTLTSIDVKEELTEWPAAEARGTKQKISIAVAAPSFLYHHVRLLAGALKAVGANDLTVKDVQELLEAKDVARAPQMAPAHGLYLADVAYLENYAVRPAYGARDEDA